MNRYRYTLSNCTISATAIVAAAMTFVSSANVVAQLPDSLEAKPSSQETQLPDTAEATPTPAPIMVKVADGEIQFSASGNWSVAAPQSRLLEAELKIPAIDGDEQDGRLTIMGAGGSVAANIDRWKAQFIASKPENLDDAGNQDQPTKTAEKKIGDQTVTFVDISGTFVDAPGGPFSGQPKVERKNYRMLAAIIQTKKHGNYFVKFYGPAATIEKNAAPFKAMIESLQIAD